MQRSIAIKEKIKNLQKKMQNGETVNMELNYIPLKKQALMHENTKEILLYGGAVGGGKSVALVIDAVKYAMENPGVKCALFRKTRASALSVFLQDGFEKFIPHEYWNYNDRYSAVELVNGSVIFLYYLNISADRDKYQGQAWEYLGVDECTLFAKKDLTFLMSRCRSAARNDGFHPPRRVRLTANPGGKSHAYIKRLFIDRDFQGQEYPELYDYIFSSLTDNDYLMKDEGYRQNFMSMDENMRRRYLEGDWGIGDGVFLDQFDPRVSVQVPFHLPDHWPRYMALDYGYSDHTVVGWFAKSPMGKWYMYREATFQRKSVHEICKTIKALCKDEKITVVYGDPSIYQKHGVVKDATMASAGLVFKKYGINVVPGNNDRKLGGMLVREWLTPQETLEDEQGNYALHTKLTIFNNCKYTLETIPHLVCDPEEPDDIEHGRGKKQDDHAYDMLRYMITSQNGTSDFYGDALLDAYEESVARNKYTNSERYMLDRYLHKEESKSYPTTIEGFLDRGENNFDAIREHIYNQRR